MTLDNGTAGNDGRLRVLVDSFEPVEFGNKGSLTINAGVTNADAADTIVLVYTDPVPGMATVTVNAGEGADNITVRATSSGIGTSVNAGGGNDAVLVNSQTDGLGSLDLIAGLDQHQSRGRQRKLAAHQRHRQPHRQP